MVIKKRPAFPYGTTCIRAEHKKSRGLWPVLLGVVVFGWFLLDLGTSALNSVKRNHAPQLVQEER